MNNINNQYNNFSSQYSETQSVYDDASIRNYYHCIDFPLQGTAILDVGCGDGLDMSKLHHLGAAEVYGIDPSSEMIQLTQSRNLPGSSLVALGERLPFPKQSFDHVFSKWSLQTSEHVANIQREVARVIKPGGYYVFLTKHPIQQWMEKSTHSKDYFKQEVVESRIYDKTITLHEPSQQLTNYLSPEFLTHFEILSFYESYDFPASEQIGGHVYPTYFIVKARRKQTILT
jgi:ubiquinone/menaquinone biosynthesis C-methylase UbiE